MLQQLKMKLLGMSKNLIPLTISAPGFFGLNSQRSGSILPVGWATKLNNFVFDDLGRIASRKGSKRINATAISGSPTIRSIHEYLDDSGNTVNILAADNKIWKEVSGIITDVSGTITTPTGDDWQFVNFNGWCVGFQDGHAPIVATSATTPSFADSGGTQFNGSMVLSAYGRLWTVKDNTFYYSDLLINNFTGGSSGNLDLAKFWPNGMDEAVALIDFNGLLIVFGKESIIVYEGADDVNNISIIEGIESIGCIARDSIQVIGQDVVFLSSSGLRSLGRTLKDDYLPIGDISQHVRDELIGKSRTETLVTIKSVYNPDDGYYLLSLPTSGVSYYFDLKFPNQDGTWKATIWTIAPTALFYKPNTTMYAAIDSGYMSTVTGFKDSVLSNDTGGVSYTIDYEGVWNDLGDSEEDVSNLLKIPKNVSVLGSGTAASDVIFKWSFDYSDIFLTRPLTFTNELPAQYGVAQYGIDTYSFSGSFERVRSQLSSAGQVIKSGIQTTINGTPFALQRFDILVKLGRLSL